MTPTPDRHESYGIPSNARYRRHTYPLPERRDPDYDEPRPLDWAELRSPWLWIAAVALLSGFAAFCVLMFALVPGPG